MLYQLSKMLQRRMERLERDSADKKKTTRKIIEKVKEKIMALWTSVPPQNSALARELSNWQSYPLIIKHSRIN